MPEEEEEVDEGMCDLPEAPDVGELSDSVLEVLEALEIDEEGPARGEGVAASKRKAPQAPRQHPERNSASPSDHLGDLDPELASQNLIFAAGSALDPPQENASSSSVAPCHVGEILVPAPVTPAAEPSIAAPFLVPERPPAAPARGSRDVGSVPSASLVACEAVVFIGHGKISYYLNKESYEAVCLVHRVANSPEHQGPGPGSNLVWGQVGHVAF